MRENTEQILCDALYQIVQLLESIDGKITAIEQTREPEESIPSRLEEDIRTVRRAKEVAVLHGWMPTASVLKSFEEYLAGTTEQPERKVPPPLTKEELTGLALYETAGLVSMLSKQYGLAVYRIADVEAMGK